MPLEEDHISFGEVRQPRVSAHAEAQAPPAESHSASNAGNTFIDPASFALAVYGAPLGEHLGSNAAPILGASIDSLDQTSDTVGDGWASRMGRVLDEPRAGISMGLSRLMTGNPLEMLGGTATNGGCVFGGEWNTASPSDHGLTLGDAAHGSGHVAGSGAPASGHMVSDAQRGVGDAPRGASGAVLQAWHSLWD